MCVYVSVCFFFTIFFTYEILLVFLYFCFHLQFVASQNSDYISNLRDSINHHTL